MDARIDRVVTGDRADRNAWVIGDDDEVIVVDPGRDGRVVLDAVGDREIIAVICRTATQTTWRQRGRWPSATRPRWRCTARTG